MEERVDDADEDDYIMWFAAKIMNKKIAIIPFTMGWLYLPLICLSFFAKNDEI